MTPQERIHERIRGAQLALAGVIVALLARDLIRGRR